jgi:4-amino-4-deoxy-L-arabinose transferase-like glycosyltransferase
VEARDRRIAVALAVVLAVALALRVAYILGQRGDVLFDYPVVDEERYVAMGRALAEGHVADPRPWFHPPGVVYALAAVFWACGPDLLAPRLVQAMVSTASCGLAFAVGRRLFSPRVGLAAAAVCAVHGVLVFETYELLPPTWMVASDLLALWLLLRAAERRTPETSLLAGLALGVAAVFGPTVLPFAVFAAAWLRRPALVAALAVGVALPIAPVTWSNWQRGHEVVVLSTNGGINFYLGNNDRYEETLAVRPGEHWMALQEEPARAGVVAPGAQSAWFYERGRAFWWEHPAAAFSLYLRKLYLFFDGPEIARDTDVYAMRSDSALLRALVIRGPPWLPDGLLVPLALVGAAVCWRDRKRLLPAYAFVAMQALVIAAFFATSRYRVPALPVLAMFAAAGVERLASASRRKRVAAAAAFAALAVALNVATHESSTSFAAELDFYRGLASARYLHRLPPAVEFFRRASAEDPGDGRIWFELGNALDSASRTDEALDAWRRAGEADPWDARARRRVAVVLTKRGDLEGAVAALRAGVDSRARPESFYAPDHLNLALLYGRRGLDPQARGELAAAQAADPRWFGGNIEGFARTVASTPDVDAAFRQAVALASRARPAAAP